MQFITKLNIIKQEEVSVMPIINLMLKMQKLESKSLKTLLEN